MKSLKVFSAVCAAVIVLSAYPMVQAAVYPVTKTELVNVANGKPVFSSDPDTHTVADWAVSNLTDGDRGTFTLSEFGPDRAGAEAFTIDLLRRCKIEKIEVFDRYDYDVSSGRANFDIIAANNDDFSDAVTLATLGATDDALFPHGGAYTVTLDGGSAYRYVKLQRTAPGDYQYAEIKVWAEQTVTDVARGTKPDRIITDALADKSHWIYDFAPPEAAFDGDTTTFWLEDGSAYRYYRVDLGKPYHIGMIEMTTRDMSADESIGDIWSKKYIKIYGSNTDDVTSSIFDPYSAPPGDSDALDIGFKKLAQVGADNPIDGEMVFPSMWIPAGTEAENGRPGKFQSTVDDTEPFRYFTYKHYLSLGASLSTFSLYVIHPEANSVSIDGDSIFINFSDEMDTSTLNSDNIAVYADDKRVDFAVDFPDGYTTELKLDRTYYDAKIKVELSKDIESAKDVNLADDVAFNIVAPRAVEVSTFILQDKKHEKGNAVTSLDGLSQAGAYIELKNNMPDKSENVIVLTVLYDENNTIIAMNEKRATVEPLCEETIICGLDIENGTKSRMATYIWRDYNVMKPWVNRKITE